MNSSSFVAPFGLSNPHLQTLTPRILFKPRQWSGHWQPFELADGDFVDLCWRRPPDRCSSKPILLLFHGLEGSVDSPYIWQTMELADALGWQTLVMHFRGCGKSGLNRLPRAYHSGDIGDASAVIDWLQQRFGNARLLTAGFSLGGNMLAQLLANSVSQHLQAAAIACAPLDLHSCSERIDRGLSRIYRRYLLTPLKQKFRLKREQGIIADDHPLANVDTTPMQSFFEFDNDITAPLHGFKNVDDYYHRASGRQFLAHITTPTLIIHAHDDPFMGAAVVPTAKELSAAVTYEVSHHGGHMGFVERKYGRWQSWLPQRLISFLQHQLMEAR